MHERLPILVGQTGCKSSRAVSAVVFVDFGHAGKKEMVAQMEELVIKESSIGTSEAKPVTPR